MLLPNASGYFDEFGQVLRFVPRAECTQGRRGGGGGGGNGGISEWTVSLGPSAPPSLQGIHVSLNTDPSRAMRCMAAADLLIMSESSFSDIAAALSRYLDLGKHTHCNVFGTNVGIYSLPTAQTRSYSGVKLTNSPLALLPTTTSPPFMLALDSLPNRKSV